MRGLTTIAWLLVAAGACWVGAIVFAPIGIASSSGAARVCALAAYAAGSLVCHQIPARSFHVAGHQLAVCGRCTGLYVAALAGGIAALLTWRRLRIDDRSLLLLAAVPTGMSWGLEHIGLAAQSNMIRAAAALPLGFAGAWVVIGMLTADSRKRPTESYKFPSAV